MLQKIYLVFQDDIKQASAAYGPPAYIERGSEFFN